MLSTVRSVIFTTMSGKREQLLQFIRQQQLHGGSLVTQRLQEWLRALRLADPDDWNDVHMPRDKWLRQLIMARAIDFQSYASACLASIDAGDHQAISVDHTFSCAK